MDHDNLARLQAIRPSDATADVDLLLRRYGVDEEVVPDPYYGGAEGFDHVLELVEQAAEGLLDEARSRL